MTGDKMQIGAACLDDLRQPASHAVGDGATLLRIGLHGVRFYRHALPCCDLNRAKTALASAAYTMIFASEIAATCSSTPE